MRTCLLFLLAISACSAAEEADVFEIVEPPPLGSRTRDDGIAAFMRIHEVVTHPRCANCHVGENGVPMWSGPSYGRTRAHDMDVQAGASRIGVETLPCSSCHRTATTPGSVPHAPPHAGLAWRLPPATFAWFDRTATEICAQLSDPARTGGRDGRALAEHLIEDANHRGFVWWGWNPGAGREPAPYSLRQHVEDMLIWHAAGQPCPPAS